MIGFSSLSRFKDYKNRLRLKRVRFHSWFFTSVKGRVGYYVTIINQ